MSILYCQNDLGFDPFLFGNGFHYLFFYFCSILLSLFVISELYIYIYIYIYIRVHITLT